MKRPSDPPHGHGTEVSFALPDPPVALPARSARAATVARWFALDEALRRQRGDGGDEAGRAAALPPPLDRPIRAGTIAMITGASGSGKSSLLRRMHEVHALQPRAIRWLDLSSIDPPDLPLVDCFGDEPLESVLPLLSRVGLAEAWSYLRTPGELSEGQRWRLKLAMALRDCSKPTPETSTVLACDEFAAMLDRVTARIVARALRKLLAARGSVSAIIATPHDCLARALLPDLLIRCDFGQVSVTRAADVVLQSREVRDEALEQPGGVRGDRAVDGCDRTRCR